MTRIGVFGAGQLGQMLGFAGASLDLTFVFLDPAENPPGAAAGRVIRRSYDDPQGLQQLAAESDIVTYEFENVPLSSVEAVAKCVPVYPPVEALSRAQDRLKEKQLFADLEIPIPEYQVVDSKQHLQEAIRRLGTPLLLKTRHLGYDGKGQYLLHSAADLGPAWRALAGQPLIAEQWVRFDREVSAIGVRSRSGASAAYPLTENRHKGGILLESRAPYDHGPLTELANKYVDRLLSRLNYVGVLALELFVVKDTLLANEFAPRVHNSGHWTIDGAETSQFTNHLRAILGLPPGTVSATGHTGMINLIGSMPVEPESITAMPAFFHDYGKAPRPGRKLGHVNVVADNAAARDAKISAVVQQLGR